MGFYNHRRIAHRLIAHIWAKHFCSNIPSKISQLWIGKIFAGLILK
jgi:hypothetical protein